MKVLEIKNNLVKVSYDTEDKLVLAGFVVIEDEKSPYVAQIVSLKADSGISYAIARLIFTFDDDGIVKNYNGSIPALQANVSSLTPAELLDILPVKTPMKLGSIAQQDFILNVDESILENNLLICSDNAQNTRTLISNFTKQLGNDAKSSIVFDIDGKLKDEKRIVFGEHFKLPLNFDTINFIYGNDLNDIDSTSKAVIQDIFLEVQNYTKTIPDKYIPFDTFIDVVDQQYAESNIPELAHLKNKLLKYKEEKVFAQSKYEINSLKEYIKDNYTVILDISNVSAKLQREIIFYVYSVLEEMDTPITSFIKINNENSDKKLLRMLFNENKINTNIICNHNYKYVYELKEKTGNYILFAPETTQHDFASYNTFLNKLNHDEFIVWGTATQRIPLIVELAPIEIIKDEPPKVVYPEPLPTEETQQDLESSVETEEIETTEQDVQEEEPAEDFTENEDTYTDLTDDIERKPVEEEDYSALNQNEEIAGEEEDFDEEFENNLAEPLEEQEITLSEPEIVEEEASTNDFFTETEPYAQPETSALIQSQPEYSESFSMNQGFSENPQTYENPEMTTHFEPVHTGASFLNLESLTVPQTEVQIPESEESMIQEEILPAEENISEPETQTYFEPLEIQEEMTQESEIIEEMPVLTEEYRSSSPAAAASEEEDDEDEDENFITESYDKLQNENNSVIEPEITEEDFAEEAFSEGEDETVLPEPSIDERIADDLSESEVNAEFEDENFEDEISEELPSDAPENILEEEYLEVAKDTQTEELQPIEEPEEITPFENTLLPEPAPLIQEDEFIEEPAEPSIEESESIEDESLLPPINEEILDNTEEDELTEDDLDIIDDINQGNLENSEPALDIEEQEEIAEATEDDSAPQQETQQVQQEPEPPVVPVFEAKIPEAQQNFEQGDHVTHPKYGEGIIEKMIKYGSKTLCSINFVNVGRRLLDPAISEISKL